MDILIPFPLIGLAIVAVVQYIRMAMKRQKGGDPRACFKLAALWSIWTLVALIYTVMLIPPPPPELGAPIQLPTPETLFSVAIYFVFLPVFAVWVLMMLDLIVYVLKTRYRFRAANQSESKQVEALSSL
jgi:hypothetical protein